MSKSNGSISDYQDATGHISDDNVLGHPNPKDARGFQTEHENVWFMCKHGFLQPEHFHQEVARQNNRNRRTPVEIPGDSVEFDDEACARHFIKMKDAPESTVQHTLPGPESTINKTTVVIDHLRRRKRSESPPPQSRLENSAFGPEKRKRRLHSPPAQEPPTRKESAASDQLLPPRSRFSGPEKRPTRPPSPPTRRLQSIHSRVSHRFQSRDPPNSAVGASNKIHQFRVPSPSHSLQNSRSVVSAGKRRHISRSPSSTRTFQNSASQYESSPQIRISGAFPLSPPSPEHPNPSDSSSDVAQTARATPSCASGSTSLRQPLEILPQAPPVSKIPRPQSPPPRESLETGSNQKMQLSKSVSSAHGMTNPTSVETAFSCSSAQNKLPPPKDLTSGGNFNKFTGQEKKTTPPNSNCQCRLSAIRSILASGLDPLEQLLQKNLCNGQRYKETAQVFLRMFDQVQSVQECGEHLHDCSNSAA